MKSLRPTAAFAAGRPGGRRSRSAAPLCLTLMLTLILASFAACWAHRPAG